MGTEQSASWAGYLPEALYQALTTPVCTPTPTPGAWAELGARCPDGHSAGQEEGSRTGIRGLGLWAEPGLGRGDESLSLPVPHAVLESSLVRFPFEREKGVIRGPSEIVLQTMNSAARNERSQSSLLLIVLRLRIELVIPKKPGCPRILEDRFCPPGPKI